MAVYLSKPVIRCQLGIRKESCMKVYRVPRQEWKVMLMLFRSLTLEARIYIVLVGGCWQLIITRTTWHPKGSHRNTVTPRQFSLHMIACILCFCNSHVDGYRVSRYYLEEKNLISPQRSKVLFPWHSVKVPTLELPIPWGPPDRHADILTSRWFAYPSHQIFKSIRPWTSVKEKSLANHHALREVDPRCRQGAADVTQNLSFFSSGISF